MFLMFLSDVKTSEFLGFVMPFAIILKLVLNSNTLFNTSISKGNR